MSTIGKGVELARSVRSATRRAGKKFRSRNFYTLQDQLESARDEGAGDGDTQRAIATALLRLNQFDEYSDQHIMPAHVLEERDQDRSS